MGFRVGSDGWGGRSLPRTGVIHITSLSAHIPGWLHVQPYKDSVVHAMSDLVHGTEAPQVQLTQLRHPDGEGLGSDGAYGHATMCLALVICALTVESNPDSAPLHLKELLGCIRVSSVPPAKTAVARMVQCILAEFCVHDFVIFKFDH